MSLHGKSMGSITDLAGTDQLDSPKLYPKLVERGFSALDHHVTNSIVLVHAGSQTFCLLGNLDEGDKVGHTFSPPTLKDGGSMPTSCRSLGEALGKHGQCSSDYYANQRGHCHPDRADHVFVNLPGLGP